MAKMGGKVIVGTWATFYQRAYDQIAHEVCLNNLPITMLVTNASILGDPNDTHAGIYDIAMFSSIPGLLYLAPAFKEDYVSILNWSLDNQKCALAVRIPWHGVKYSGDASRDDWTEVKYNIRETGNTVAILALGGLYIFGEKVKDLLYEKYKIRCTLIDPVFANRTDNELLDLLEKDHILIVTIEDAAIRGGFGAMISQYYSDRNVIVKNFGFTKPLSNEFDSEKIMEENNLSVPAIFDYISEILLSVSRSDNVL